MARLTIVSGASGAGKTFLLENLASFTKVVPIVKYTTRSARLNEAKDKTIDLFLDMPDDKIQECDYSYQYCGENYGIIKNDIDKAINKNKNPIVIIAQCSTIVSVKKDYPNALVLYVQNTLSGNDLKTQLEKYRDPVTVEERMNRQIRSFADFSCYRQLFDDVLVNDFSEFFIEQMQRVYLQKVLNGVDDNYIFVIMSYKDEYDEVYKAYKLAGRLIASIRKVEIEIVKDRKGSHNITDEIERCLNRAGLVICDVSEDSPNVYYEFGYTKALKKQIIITAKEGTVLPFDTRQYNTIFYKTALELQEKIVDELQYYYSIKQ